MSCNDMLYITGSLINLKIKLKTHGTANLSLLGEVVLWLPIPGTHNYFSVHKYTLDRHTHSIHTQTHTVYTHAPHQHHHTT